MRRGWSLLTLAVVAALPAAAHGEERGELEAEAFTPPPVIARGRTYSELIARQLTVLGDSVDGHLGALTLDAVTFRIDGPARRARLRLAGETRFLSIKVEGNVHFRKGAAEVATTVDLTVAGRLLRFELPELEVLPRSYLGERYVEVRLPLFRGEF